MKDYGLRLLHKKILEITLYIDRLCKEHDIQYYLMGGSALGAIRHQGFIPWDDDLDIFMTPENYSKFIEVCKSNLDLDKYYLQEENTNEWPLQFSKIRMNGTTYIEADNKDREMHQGIFVDIFCLTNLSKYKIIAFHQFLCGRLLTAQSLGIRDYYTKNKMKKLTINIMKFLPQKTLNKLLKKQINLFNHKECEYLGHFLGRSSFKNSVFPKSYLGTPRYVTFENVKLPIPEKTEELLEIMFGDYMKLPSEKERRASQHALIIDLNKSYEDYI